MKRRLPWLLFAPLLLVAGCGNGGDQRDVKPQQALLRLSDLPRGYDVGDDTGCGLDTEGASPRLANLVIKYRPTACSAEFASGYPADRDPANPGFIQSIAVKFPTDASAAEGMRSISDLLAWEGRAVSEAAESPEPPPIGDETRAFHVGATRWSGPGSVICWRDGVILDCIYVTTWTPGARRLVKGSGVGRTVPRLDAAALAYARKQQAHTESPGPVSGPKEADPALALGDPRLGIPVYWLGRDFNPGGGLPPIHLSGVTAPVERGGGPAGERIRIEYSGGVSLDSWSAAKWPGFRRGALGRVLADSPCTRVRRVPLPQGHALIYAGYSTKARSCPDRPPRHYFAHVFLGPVVVGVNIPICFTCLGGGPYSSLAGTLAIVHGLERRAPGG